jgi:hypothetical protein
MSDQNRCVLIPSGALRAMKLTVSVRSRRLGADLHMGDPPDGRLGPAQQVNLTNLKKHAGPKHSSWAMGVQHSARTTDADSSQGLRCFELRTNIKERKESGQHDRQFARASCAWCATRSPADIAICWCRTCWTADCQ